jgi:tRNA modification GTPase
MREGLEKIADSNDTIVAVSTPYGRSGIGVVRFSGKDCRRLAEQFFERAQGLRVRTATVGKWVDDNKETVDEVIVTLFAGPNSYTGEDMLEVSAHGNPVILNRVVQLAQSAGARAARPGEFTLRAVANGRLDLTQAEAVHDFIEAQTLEQAKVARRQMEGALSKRVKPLKDSLVDLIAHLEAGIDFSDDDVAPPDSAGLAGRARSLAACLKELQRSYNYGRLLLEGGRVVIVGRPNVGKSSLFNALLEMERAIVSDIPGTTRDVVSERIDLEGVPLRFLDTAGLRDTVDPVEKIGVNRTREALAEADLTLVVVDGSEALRPDDLKIIRNTAEVNRILVWNKTDLGKVAEEVEDMPRVRVSAKTGEGLENLRGAIRKNLGVGVGESLGDSVLTHARQYEAVARAKADLDSVADDLAAAVPHEMVALNLYAALAALNELTGETVTDDILGRIFASFCVGK